MESHIQLAKVNSFLKEAFAWYASGTFIILTRIAVRVRTVSFRNIKGNDYLAFLTLALYTLGIIVVDIAYKTGTNNNVTPANINLLTDKDVTNLTLGSKVQLVAWYEYITLIYDEVHGSHLLSPPHYRYLPKTVHYILSLDLLGDIYCGHLNPYIWLLSNFKQFASSPSPFESLLLQAAKLLR
ncbi:hypothetical protein HBI56_167090 [Parastagonospora nodorum]|nr:hypothetical protein HBH51_041830 [Parastagonospora nodorum]KAH4302271.1 hypothetical protein HBI02_138510 [Parastagonospora nodorum]KAH4374400.1 hypothetical protein HBH94_101590 [Parastagonospora nodorum]KAH4491136.1 hypothetical protein HBH88_112460 [Parastagonospora nodorum]KAH4656394.1 hypothetical protein HBH80_162160 [Parastagonospora nodorum]